MLALGTNVSIPGNLLRDPGDMLSKPELEDLVKYLSKMDQRPPIPTGAPKEVPVPEPPKSITHVYTKQNNRTGLQPQFCGPFPVVSRPSRTTVKLKVGLDVQGNPRYELRNWRDLKVAHMRPDTQEALRPKRGRPSKASMEGSEAASKPSNGNKNKQPDALQNSAEVNKPNSNLSGRPTRATRNPNPIYVDAISGPPPLPAFSTNQTSRATLSSTPWSATSEEIAHLNRWIGSTNNNTIRGV